MRFHVHTHVDDRRASIAFQSKMFGAQPLRTEGDYAKWHLDNPRLNFAISTRGSKAGVDHLGFQAATPEELAQHKARAEAADGALLDEGATTCCYAGSDKHGITDPQGIAWEHFQTLGGIPVFSEPRTATVSPAAQASACCAPRAPEMDFVITVCDNAAGETCPVWPGQPMTAHCGLPDPAAVEGSQDAKLQAFRDVAVTMKQRLDIMQSLPLERLDRLALRNQVRDVPNP